MQDDDLLLNAPVPPSLGKAGKKRPTLSFGLDDDEDVKGFPSNTKQVDEEEEIISSTHADSNNLSVPSSKFGGFGGLGLADPSPLKQKT